MPKGIRFKVTVELSGHEKSPTIITSEMVFKPEEKEKAQRYFSQVHKAIEAAFTFLRGK